tara:strand:+ start:270 stop:467 length:198 start_codon:yes stop_codon:yes gene_type:complete
MNRKEAIDFARYEELNSLLRWMETYMRDASEEQLESYLGIKNELLRRIISLDEENMTLGSWRKSE